MYHRPMYDTLGAADLIADWRRLSRYIIDSLIETTLSRDILLLTRVDKPALLRRLFQLGCTFSGQILSYQKMIGQLQDACTKSARQIFCPLQPRRNIF